MTAPTQSVYRIADVRVVERALPSADLMARAGAAALAVLGERWPHARHIVVVAGPGNNGGDGRVLARLAQKAGVRVEVVDVDSRRGGAAPAIPSCDVIIDALFGIGLSRAPDGGAAALIDAMNAHAAPVLALDVPSGLDADSGDAPGAVVIADATVTFLCHKPGLFNRDGPRCSGAVSLASLGVPADAFDGLEPLADVIARGRASALLGIRARDAHKGSFGHVLVIGGNAGLGGAAALAADAALRCGSGRVSVAVPSGLGARSGARAEAMVHECDAASLAPLLERATVIAIGPGLGTDDWARAVLDAALACGKPLVADADALNLIAARPATRADWIVTPHPGEAARLLGTTTEAVQRDRRAAARSVSDATGAVTVLKGAATVVGGRAGRPAVWNAGHPGMAGAG